MKYQIYFRSEAESDLQQAYDWYQSIMPGLGDDFLISVDAAVHSVQRNPRLYLLVYKNVRRALLRRFPYGLFYVIRGTNIVVLAAFHMRQDLRGMKNRI